MKNIFKLNYFTKILIIYYLKNISRFLPIKNEIDYKKLWSKYFWNLSHKDKLIYDFFNMLIKELKILHLLKIWFWFNENYTINSDNNWNEEIKENIIKKINLHFSFYHLNENYDYLPLCIKKLLINSYYLISKTNILQQLLNIYKNNNIYYQLKIWYISNYEIKKHSRNFVNMSWSWLIRYYFSIFNKIGEYTKNFKKESTNILFSEISYFFIDLINEFFYILNIFLQNNSWKIMIYSTSNSDYLESLAKNNILKIIDNLYNLWKIKKEDYELYMQELNKIS